MKDNINPAILVLAIFDIMADIATLNSIVSEQEEDNTDKHPLIGRRYIVRDQSYAIDKETSIDVRGLNGKEYIIVSDPYVAEIPPIFSDGEPHSHIFVDVFSTDSTRKYRVLFQENCIVKED